MGTSKKTPAEIFAAHALASQAKKELTENILPYWTQKMCNPSGGFHGRITGREQLDPEAPRGAIMNARLLWTFASAHRLLGSQATGEAGKCPADGCTGEEAGSNSDGQCTRGNDSRWHGSYLDMAFRAKREIIDKFYDPEHGGIYWSLDASGNPLDTKKQIYAIAFAIYGLSELYRACGDSEALEYAIKLFHDIEEHSFDSEKDGYFEAFTREWNTIGDMRLSDKDANESKTMNTHLHVLEAYTCLFRVWKDELLEKRLRGLVGIFEKHILGPDGHLRLFFDDDWHCGYNIVSYGHDIEASWLIHEAALVLGDDEVLRRVENLVPLIAAAAGEGFTQEGGMIYEMHGQQDAGSCGNGSGSGNGGTEDAAENCHENNGCQIDSDRHWWVQAESVVGYFNLWEHFGDQAGLENAIMCWEFIKAHIIDRENGEWFWSLRADGTVNREDDKAGFWKCPYHNGRMCMELIERTR